jgi:NAD(P)-dependent dehydrogenase (short-subunit alcohol dehydrogenase family)/threonine dehydrogenase-like Zn-dependent dehydrogenase
MSNDLQAYIAGETPVPDSQRGWQLWGVGLENFGTDDKPETIPVPENGPNELLARVDAAGLCFSDIKILNLGGDHPRLFGRDLSKEPIIMGHEVALTIVKVGDNLRGKYHVGDRFVVQAEIYFKGKNLAFGYMLPGGLEQYVKLGAEVLEGDDGVYLIPIHPETGYSEAALAEPWACVVRAYRTEYRSTVKENGIAWVIGTPGSENATYKLGYLSTGPTPRKLVCTDVPPKLMQLIRRAAGAPVEEVNGIADLDVKAVFGDDGADDIFVLGSGSPEAVEKGGQALAKNGSLTLVTDKPLDRKVSIDVGRIHYDGLVFRGCKGPNVSEAYTDERKAQLKPGGLCWMVGGAGPMGQMHVQLALEKKDPPKVVVASDIDADRLATVPERYGATAKERGIELICLNPKELGNEGFEAKLREIAPDGFDDVVVLVPVPAIISHASGFMAADGMLNIFAGVARGTMANLDLSDVALKGVRYTGTSGSAIEDLQTTLHMAEQKELSPNRSVAAVGGIQAAKEGLYGVKGGSFAGKVIIYPQLADLELTPIEKLCEKYPTVAAKLGPGCVWTREAELELLRLPLAAESGTARSLTGKVAMITGAAQGLGEALAERMAAAGAHLIIIDVNEAGAQATAARLAEQHDIKAIGIGADITDEDQVAAAFTRAAEDFCKLDILVSNAGILASGDITSFDVAKWRKVIDVNLVGYMILAKYAAKVMIAQQSGIIVQINSKSGKVGSYKNSAYAASKFGGIGLTQSLALELAEQGIRVNAVCPGNLLDSPLWKDKLFKEYAANRGMTEQEVYDFYVNKVPMKRGCTYDDVADVLMFLVSPASGYMTGQAINVDGGQTMH